MGSSAWLATQLDERMLDKRIEPAFTENHLLPMRTGTDVAKELGGRLLLRYVRLPDWNENREGIASCVSPTPYSPDDAAAYLALPAPNELRTHVIFIDPTRIERIAGPRWCALGSGIEYLLPDGYPKAATLTPQYGVPVR